MGFRNPQETGRPVKIKDEGLTLVNNVASIDLVGAGVTATALGDEVTETIPGGGGGGVSNSEAPLSGVIDGSNDTFTFAHSVGLLVLNGATLAKVIGSDGDYTVSGTSSPYTVTFVPEAIPQSGILRNYY